ncbi:hypothetical protein ACNKHM_19530 [Shigella sonnei]
MSLAEARHDTVRVVVPSVSGEPLFNRRANWLIARVFSGFIYQ